MSTLTPEQKVLFKEITDRLNTVENRLLTLEELNQKLARAYISEPTKHMGTGGQTKVSQPLTPNLQPTQSPPTQQQNSILDAYPPALANQLTAELQNGNLWIIKAKTWIPSKADFAEICKITKDLGGQYIQEPKNNHWEIKEA